MHSYLNGLPLSFLDIDTDTIKADRSKKLCRKMRKFDNWIITRCPLRRDCQIKEFFFFKILRFILWNFDISETICMLYLVIGGHLAFETSIEIYIYIYIYIYLHFGLFLYVLVALFWKYPFKFGLPWLTRDNSMSVWTPQTPILKPKLYSVQ